jgi:hypothetical protein
MEDGDSKNDLEENFLGKRICKASYDGDVLQPIWVRCCSVLSYYCDREYLERQFNHVLNLGVIFWSIFLLSQKF